MFLKKSSYDDFTKELETNLKNHELAPLEEKIAANRKATELLLKAADLFDELGDVEVTDAITDVLTHMPVLNEKLAWHVPTSDTAGLTSDKMENNLKQKGWVFNANDGKSPTKSAPNKPAVNKMLDNLKVDDLEVSDEELNEEDTKK